MGLKLKKAFVLVGSLSIFLFAANIVHGQDHTRRLHSPAKVKGFVGGESHDSYVIHARKGQVMTVEIAWARVHDKDNGDNRAEFFVGTLPNFDGDGQVKFGHESNNGKRWSGKIPKTGNYYIYVMAHPTAHYTLKVTTK